MLLPSCCAITLTPPCRRAWWPCRYVAVEPVEPQLTEMLWVNSSQIERRRM